MRRGSHDMQVNVAGIRRNIKNFAHNYSDAQKKVREATSNDPWGPSSTIMAEIADLTYNVVAFSEIMQMIWKRLNDHGRNWRHVYKALVLLDYLIKTGSEKVGQQCKENIFAIQTLRDFQHLEDGKDQGQNVREKAKQLVNLLKDDERLRSERTRALKAKERFAQSASGLGSDGSLDTPTSPKYPAFHRSGGDWSGSGGGGSSGGGGGGAGDLPREIENARPQTAGEEELQLQLALAMSREEAEQEEQKRKSDDVRLQLALSQSQQDFRTHDDKPKPNHMVDLLDINLGENASSVDPWGMPQPPRPQQSSPWQPAVVPSPPPPTSTDPWQPHATKPPTDPWLPTAAGHSPINITTTSTLPLTTSSPPPPLAPRHDPWSPTASSSSDLDDFDVITNRNRNGKQTTNGTSAPKDDPFSLGLLNENLPESNDGLMNKRTPQSFLGENSALVNLDNLVTPKPANGASGVNTVTGSPLANPFSDRPVFNQPAPKPSINEMKQASCAPFVLPTNGTTTTTTTFGTPFRGAPAAPPPAAQDPWMPATGATGGSSGGQMGTPWMKSGGAGGGEMANPFLS